MEFIKILSGLKFKSYHLAMQFLLSITVPGTLILFYFYRNLFNTYDLYRLMILIISISSSLFICAYTICSSIIFTLKSEIDNSNEDENEYLEGMFQMSSQVSLMVLFLLLLIYFLAGSKNIHSFVIWFIAIEVVFGVIIYLSFKGIINAAKAKAAEEKQKLIEAEENKALRIQQINDDIFKYKKLLISAKLELEEARKFQFLRSFETKRNQLLAINDKIAKISAKIEELESELQKLG